jgi:hypothetical protein
VPLLINRQIGVIKAGAAGQSRRRVANTERRGRRQTETGGVDEAWLSIQDSAQPAPPAKMTRLLHDQEKGIIESALAESRGKVAGAGRLPRNSGFRLRRWIQRSSS